MEMFEGLRGCFANLSSHKALGGLKPWIVCLSITGTHIETNNQSHIHTYGEFGVTNSPNSHIAYFGLWE